MGCAVLIYTTTSIFSLEDEVTTLHSCTKCKPYGRIRVCIDRDTVLVVVALRAIL